MDDMNHIESIILHFLQGVISEDEIRKLNDWLGQSDENKQLFFRVKEIYGLRPGGLYPSEEEIAQSMLRLARKMKIGATIKNQQPKTENRLTGFYKYAAIAVISICLTLGVQSIFRKDNPAVYTELYVESGPRMSRLILPDGSKVVLNASTKFKFPDKFDHHLREVFLDGEAFFEVVHNAEQPFVVHTDKQKITVLGTTFNVMDYSADDYAITTVTSGSVKLLPSESSNQALKEYILKPNQQAYLNKVSAELTLTTNVRIDSARTWVNKIYHFRDEPLIKIMQRLEKIYGVKISIVTDSLKEVCYTGTFPTGQGIDEVLKIINFDKQFSYKIDGETIVIK